MKSLQEILIENTQELKAEYLRQTESWAKDEYVRIVDVLLWDEVKWCKYFGIEPQVKKSFDRKTEYLSFPDGFYNSRNSGKWHNMRAKAQSVNRKGIDSFVEFEMKKAESHYNYSIEKLVARLVKKGIDKNRGEDLQIVSARLGVNFEMVIQVDDIKVKAWTIIASGPIQRPHYRYLVK